MNISRVAATWKWLAEAKFFWLTAAVIGAALAISLRPGTTEPTIRLAGLALQLLGILTVAWGISETRGLFGHPPLRGKVAAWLKRFPLVRRSVVLAVGAASIGAAGVKARAHVTHAPGPNATLDARVGSLERNVELLHDRIGGIEAELDSGVGKLEAELKNEQTARVTQHNALQRMLEATGTGGVHISAIGAAWLLVGVILSTAAPEIADFLRRR